MNQETVNYMGLDAPRMQKCAFCGFEYDALKGASRPHAVCYACWPTVSDIELKSARFWENKEREFKAWYDARPSLPNSWEEFQNDLREVLEKRGLLRELE